MERGILHNGALRHRRRISHRGLATPPVPQPPTNHEGSRFPSVPGKATSVFSIAECLFPTDRPALALYHPDALPLARSLHLHRQVSNRKFPVRPGSSLPRNNILPPDIAGLLIHRERWSSAPTNGSPRVRADGSLPQDCCSTILLRLPKPHGPATTTPPRSSSRGVCTPRWWPVPSSPPTTVRHAPPDVEAFCATSLLPKDPASVAAPRQPPEGRHHSLSRPHIPLLDWTQFGPATIKDAGCPDSTRNLLPNRCAVKEFRSMHSTEPETASSDRRDQNPSYRSPLPLE